jgi:16S rRNA (cytidine1402-2'-O)-methyltransferase
MEDVALVSEAGMPAISDPGYELVTAAIERGIPVVPVPGSSALIAALAVSGLPADRFLYLGFLPEKAAARRKLLASVAGERGTLVAFEAPHRLTASLKDIAPVLGDRRIAVCRELTKLHEEVFRGTVSQAIAHFALPRGEFTLVIEGNRQPAGAEPQDVEKRLEALRSRGKTAREAIAQAAAETGLPRKELYRLWLGQKPAA